MTEKRATEYLSGQSAGENAAIPSIAERASASSLRDPTDVISSLAPVFVSEQSQEIALNAHNKYFFEDGNLWLRVEDVDFKVHRYFFMRDSSKFRELSREGLRGRVECATSGNRAEAMPLVLENVTSSDFECFLGVLYPTLFGRDDATTVTQWASILQVSTHLEFQSIRALSIENLTALAPPVDKIAIGRKFGINLWLADAYHKVCTRRATLTKEEGRKLGIEETVGIMEARQNMLWENSSMSLAEQYRVIERIFGLSPPFTIGSRPTESTQAQPQNTAPSRPPRQASQSANSQPSTSALPDTEATQQPHVQAPRGNLISSVLSHQRMYPAPSSTSNGNGAAAPKPFTFSLNPSPAPTNPAAGPIFTFGPSSLPGQGNATTLRPPGPFA